MKPDDFERITLVGTNGNVVTVEGDPETVAELEELFYECDYGLPAPEWDSRYDVAHRYNQAMQQKRTVQ